MKWLRLSAACSIGVAVIFSIFSLVFYYGDWERLVVVASIGAFVGLLAAPEIDPKAFKFAGLFQTLSGAISGGIIGMAFFASGAETILAIAIGGILGFLAPYWIRVVPIP